MRATRHNERVLPDPGLSACAKLVWLYAGTLGESPFRFNVKEAARRLGVSPTTVLRSLRALHAKGVLRWEPGRGGNGDDRCGLVTVLPRVKPDSPPPVKWRAPHTGGVVEERIPPGHVTTKVAMRRLRVGTRTWAKLRREYGIPVYQSLVEKRYRLVLVKDVDFLATTLVRKREPGPWAQ